MFGSWGGMPGPHTHSDLPGPDSGARARGRGALPTPGPLLLAGPSAAGRWLEDNARLVLPRQLQLPGGRPAAGPGAPGPRVPQSRASALTASLVHPQPLPRPASPRRRIPCPWIRSPPGPTGSPRVFQHTLQTRSATVSRKDSAHYRPDEKHQDGLLPWVGRRNSPPRWCKEGENLLGPRIQEEVMQGTGKLPRSRSGGKSVDT